MECQDKIKLVITEMKKAGIDAYIVPSSDPHASEYLPEFYKTRQWASGFTGSAGTLVITENMTGLWTDGRYYIQAEKELEGSGITLFKAGTPGVPTYPEWLASVLKAGDTVGFNGFQMMTREVNLLIQQLKNQKIKVDYTSNVIDKIWLDRPYLPVEKIHMHDLAYAGETTESKLKRIREALKKEGACCHLITKLDDIAWLLNLRGSDISNNPYFLSYLFIKPEDSILYVDPLKLNEEIIDYLHQNQISVKLYEDLEGDLAAHTCEKGLLMDFASTPYHYYKSICDLYHIIDGPNPSSGFKAIKNATEIEQFKACYLQDGVTMVKFLYWLEQTVPQGGLTEYSVSEHLKALRAENPLNRGTSFDSIAAYKEHGAIMHYKAEEASAYALEPKGFLLMDSGGQYLNGTTDITRTIPLGPLTDQERFDFTLTLKSMMSLSNAIFLEGATGTHLDTIARMHMWAHEMDYKSGTGHGIGFYLGVHEGPQRIAMNPSDTPLKPGMVVTNEPGVYRAGSHGIRIENTLVVVPHKSNDFGTFYRFETITLCPIDTRALDLSVLTQEECAALNAYHQKVYDALSSHLEEEERLWLLERTKPVHKA